MKCRLGESPTHTHTLTTHPAPTHPPPLTPNPQHSPHIYTHPPQPTAPSAPPSHTPFQSTHPIPCPLSPRPPTLRYNSHLPRRPVVPNRYTHPHIHYTTHNIPPRTHPKRCILGCSNFNNLILPTLDWIKKMSVLLFWATLKIQFNKSFKNAEFYADFKFVDKL